MSEFMRGLRYWLIRLLACGDVVVMNAHFPKGFELGGQSARRRGYIYGNRIGGS